MDHRTAQNTKKLLKMKLAECCNMVSYNWPGVSTTSVNMRGSTRETPTALIKPEPNTEVKIASRNPVVISMPSKK